MKTALSISDSDSSGGVGIQADIKTMSANGVYAMAVITAMTAQNTNGIRSAVEVTPDFLKEQLDAVFEDIYPDAVKIGTIPNSILIYAVAEKLNEYKAKNIVVDTDVVSAKGSNLTTENAIRMLKKKLLPIAALATPNIAEAQILAGTKINDKYAMSIAAKLISEQFGCPVLLKGGQSVGNCDDLLYADGKHIWFEAEEIPSANTRGVGCTLSSAIAANLAKGYSLVDSVGLAKEFVSGAIASGLNLGKGFGPIDHIFDIKTKYKE